MGRIFFLTNHVCVGESGGGHGVEFRLHQADNKYNLFKNDVIYIFGDRVINGKSNVGEFKETKDQPQKSEFRLKIRKFIPSFLRIQKLKEKEKETTKYLERLDKEFEFCDEDIFVFHDVKAARPFIKRYSFRNTALVYHKQGSIYNEWHADTGLESNLMRNYYNTMFRDIVENVKFLCFPSCGTEESLITSAPELREVVEKAKKKYLYNGVFCPEVKWKEFPEWIKEIDAFDGYKFVTVAVLNAAKAVERIPQYIGALKNAGIKVTWILVGNGVNAELVQKNIDKYNINDSVIWKKDNILHSDLMRLFSITDFYILFHKYSIFDLSTLEAMHYGNIPVLTPVGGNKEMIIDNNGVFVSEFDDVSSIINIIKNGEISKLAEKNKKIKKEYFDEKPFLQRYVDLCDSMLQ